MRRRQIGLLGLGAAALFLYSKFRAVRNDRESSSYNIIENMCQNNQVVTEVEPLLRNSIEILSKIYPDINGLLVNQIAEENERSIIILDIALISKTYRNISLIEAIKKNIVSIGSRYIVADYTLIKFLLIQSNVDFGAKLQIEERAARNDLSFGKSEIRRTINQSLMLRLANAQNYRNSVDDGWGNTTVQDYNSSINILSEYDYFRRIMIGKSYRRRENF